MREGGSILAMTYYGSTKVLPSYNVMGIAKAALEASVRYVARDLGEKGIRVNAISAGPIKTLAASGVSGFRGFLDVAAERAPLRRNVSTDDVGQAGVYLLSGSRRRRHRRGALRRRRPRNHGVLGAGCASSSPTSAASSTRPRSTGWRASSSARGHRVVGALEDADLHVVNSCTVTQRGGARLAQGGAPRRARRRRCAHGAHRLLDQRRSRRGARARRRRPGGRESRQGAAGRSGGRGVSESPR